MLEATLAPDVRRLLGGGESITVRTLVDAAVPPLLLAGSSLTSASAILGSSGFSVVAPLPFIAELTNLPMT